MTARALRISALLLLVPFFASCVAEVETPGGREELSAVFLDVGQGDAALLSFGGRHWMVDAGSAGRGLPARLAALGVDSLAGIFVTHRHEDHFGGAAELLRAMPVGKLHLSGDRLESAVWSEFERTVAESGVPVDTLWRGDWIDFGTGEGEWGLRVLWPHRGLLWEGNDASLVMQLVTPAARALFTGDAGKAVEEELSGIEGTRLESELLKVAHHGSSSASSLGFLALVRPMRAVVSVGFGNDYGHPSAEAMADLALVLGDSSAVLRTDRNSDVAVSFGRGGFRTAGDSAASARARW